jgi:hypothetical protein
MFRSAAAGDIFNKINAISFLRFKDKTFFYSARALCPAQLYGSHIGLWRVL